MKVALIGAKGQLGTDLLAVLEGKKYKVVGFTHTDIEVANFKSISTGLTQSQADVVINTSAYHKVEEVEENPTRAFAVNTLGPHNLAFFCRNMNVPLVHLSTDYVFSGSKGSPYLESDPVDPVNIYGVSKAAGEMTIRYMWHRHFIIRSSGLYGKAGSSGKGGNFVELMLRLAREPRPIRVVNDQVLTPTSTRALAVQIGKLIETEAYGTYHATCQGECTWYDFAKEIFEQIDTDADLVPQSTAQSGARVRRPPYSVLDNGHLKSIRLDIMPFWVDALKSYLNESRSPLLSLNKGKFRKAKGSNAA
jgi:dTDP-4-dehydrorhamnose reductase